jgi:hypothetical protein
VTLELPMEASSPETQRSGVSRPSRVESSIHEDSPVLQGWTSFHASRRGFHRNISPAAVGFAAPLSTFTVAGWPSGEHEMLASVVCDHDRGAPLMDFASSSTRRLSASRPRFCLPSVAGRASGTAFWMASLEDSLS